MWSLASKGHVRDLGWLWWLTMLSVVSMRDLYKQLLFSHINKKKITRKKKNHIIMVYRQQQCHLI